MRHLLWMTIYQAFFMRKAVYHVVDEAVEYAKMARGQGTANFVNAVLRRSIRERESLALPADPVSRLSVEYSFPLWLVKRWRDRFGPKDVAALLGFLNRTPEFGLRVDTGRITKAAVKQRLTDLGIDVKDGRYVEGALIVDRVGPLLTDELLTTLLVHVQDETSQMAVLALAPSRGDLVLDACAGQGTKTGQIKETSPGARIAAMDMDRGMVKAIRATTCLLQADAKKKPFKTGCFDSILLDAPCSSLGIIRKHPEIRWRRKEKDIKRHGAMQREMIGALSESLKAGGRLVYSVCSFEPEETLDVVDEFVKAGSLVLDPGPFAAGAPWFLSLPHVTGMDGFFIARFRKP